MRHFKRTLYLLLILTGVMPSCSSSLSSRAPERAPPLTQGERVYLARYNPCACVIGEAEVSVELSPIAQEDLERLRVQLSQLDLTSSKPTKSKEERTLPAPDREADTQSSSTQFDQSAHLTSMMSAAPISALWSQTRSWERVELTSADALKYRPMIRQKESSRPLALSDPDSDARDLQRDLESPEVLNEEAQRRAELWHALWRWWPQNAQRHLLLRVQLQAYSQELTGHMIRQGELLNVEVSFSP